MLVVSGWRKPLWGFLLDLSVGVVNAESLGEGLGVSFVKATPVIPTHSESSDLWPDVLTAPSSSILSGGKGAPRGACPLI